MKELISLLKETIKNFPKKARICLLVILILLYMSTAYLMEITKLSQSICSVYSLSFFFASLCMYLPMYAAIKRNNKKKSIYLVFMCAGIVQFLCSLYSTFEIEILLTPSIFGMLILFISLVSFVIGLLNSIYITLMSRLIFKML
jgi:xanthine/uracil permease